MKIKINICKLKVANTFKDLGFHKQKLGAYPKTIGWLEFKTISLLKIRIQKVEKY